MKKIDLWRACAVAIALLAAMPANAIVMFNADYLVGVNAGDTGVSVGDTVHVSAFYDPLYAQLTFQDQRSLVHSFDAGHAGLSFTVGDLVWRTTGPLSINTYYVEDNLGRPKYVGLEFLGNTRIFMEGQVSTTLATPWSSEVTGQQWINYLPKFTARLGLDPDAVLSPRLYTEMDFASLLEPVTDNVIGSALAVTANGNLRFTLQDPNYVGPVASVPEPSGLALFGMGLLGLAFGRRRSAKLSAVAA